jgi:acyl transferase domain-containing protein/NAD(P)-dependent dehydrogenase (short-subunit alcohol dehydrogenase family)/acyl carrier protein
MNHNPNEIAIIGLSGIFPEASNLHEFFRNLSEGKDSVRTISRERLGDCKLDMSKSYQISGFLNRIDTFDHSFFGISKQEAELMDPSHRILLELTCEAIENAGYSLKSFYGSSTALYLGGDPYIGYHSLIEQADATIITGNLHAMAAGRIAYWLNLNGPVMMVDTACSSSLVAVHEACQKIKFGEVDYAIAGGFSTIINFPQSTALSGDVGIFSPGGKCKAFDAEADGIGGGEGGGVVLLKRLDKALKDGDHIHAVVKGSAVNHDGSRSNGIAAPSPIAQTEVIKKAWANASVDPETISYIEAHGTGTRLGDPIEFQALTDAFNSFSTKKNFCAVGSVKTNIGHLNNAAGVAGLIKAVIALKNKKLFPSLHFNTPNPYIDFENSAAIVNTNLTDWKSNGNQRRCGISSFGLSGTNVHLVLEEAPVPEILISNPTEKGILKISAKTETSLKLLIQNYYKFINSTTKNLQSILYTLNKGRGDYQYRCAIVAENKNQLLTELKKLLEKDTFLPISKKKGSVVLLFSGNNPTRDLVEELLQSFPIFKHEFEKLNSEYSVHYSSLSERVQSFIVQYALFKLWFSCGIMVESIIATGIGKVTKKVIVNNLSIKEAFDEILTSDFSSVIDKEKFYLASKELSSSGYKIFLEVGGEGSLSQTLKDFNNNLEDIRVIIKRSNEGNSILQMLADLYLSGAEINWDSFYNNIRIPRIEAPTYPFDKIRCWTSDEVEPITGGNDLLYSLNWIKDSAAKAKDDLSKREFLVFVDRIGLGDELISQLTQQNSIGIKVILSNRFKEHSERLYEIDFSQEEDYLKLASAIEDNSFNINGIIHLASYSESETSLNSTERDLALKLYSWVFITKAFTSYLGYKEFYITNITSYANKVFEKETSISPVNSLSSAFVRGLLSSHPRLKVSSIDVPFLPQDLKTAARLIIDEISNESVTRFVSYRGDERYIQEFTPLNSISKSEFSIGACPNVFVVTGGATGIGIEICCALAKRIRNPTFLVLGRTEIGDLSLDNTTGWKANDIIQRRQNLARLDELGATVQYFSVNIGDADRMNEVFSKVKKEFKKIGGIIHSAGIGVLRVTSEKFGIADLKEIILPKVNGTLILEEVTRELRPEFFAMFSSLNAIVPQKNTIEYTVANAFLDAFALSKNNTQMHYLSINWPSWNKVGMFKMTQEVENTSILKPLEIADGIDCFLRSLTIKKSNVVVANIDLKKITETPFFVTPSNVKYKGLTKTKPAAQTSETEEKVSQIWSEVLKADAIGLDDDFFEIGGHSLNGTKVLNRIEKGFGIAIEFEELFDFSTIRQLASRIDELNSRVVQNNNVWEITKVGHKDYYEISPPQRRLWLLNQYEENIDAYNELDVYSFEGKVNIKAFAEALDFVIERHESLRTVYTTILGEPKQKILPSTLPFFRMEFNDLSLIENTDEKVNEIIVREKQTPFDLENGPLIRTKLLKRQHERFVFLLDLHHIIADGWSMEILVNEILVIYRSLCKGKGNPLSPLQIQYKDYTQWQNDLLVNGKIDKQVHYWLEKLSGVLPVLNLPIDNPRPKNKTFNTDVVHLCFDSNIKNGVNNLSKKCDASVFIVLVSALKILLYQQTHQKDIIIGTPLAGRRHPDLENQVGLFVNMIPLREVIMEDESIELFLKRVRNTVLKAYDNQDYPFDRLVDKLDIRKDLSRNPIFDIEIDLHNFDSNSLERNKDFKDFKISSFGDKTYNTGKFDLDFIFIETVDGINLSLNYNKDLFKEKTAMQFTQLYNFILKTIVNDSSIKIREINNLLNLHLEEIKRAQKEILKLSRKARLENLLKRSND